MEWNNFLIQIELTIWNLNTQTKILLMMHELHGVNITKFDLWFEAKLQQYTQKAAIAVELMLLSLVVEGTRGNGHSYKATESVQGPPRLRESLPYHRQGVYTYHKLLPLQLSLSSCSLYQEISPSSHVFIHLNTLILRICQDKLYCHPITQNLTFFS